MCEAAGPGPASEPAPRDTGESSPPAPRPTPGSGCAQWSECPFQPADPGSSSVMGEGTKPLPETLPGRGNVDKAPALSQMWRKWSPLLPACGLILVASPRASVSPSIDGVLKRLPRKCLAQFLAPSECWALGSHCCRCNYQLLLLLLAIITTPTTDDAPSSS